MQLTKNILKLEGYCFVQVFVVKHPFSFRNNFGQELTINYNFSGRQITISKQYLIFKISEFPLLFFYKNFSAKIPHVGIH